MNRIGRALVFVCLACAAAVGAERFATATGRSYHNDAMRIAEFEVPRGWTLAPQSAWPRLLVAASLDEERGVRRGEAQRETGAGETRLTLGAQKIVPGATALGMATEARAVLARQGFGDVRVEPASAGPSGEARARLEATAPRGNGSPKLLRQVYAVEGDVAVVLTLIAPRDKQGRAVRDFELAAQSLAITPQMVARPPSEDGGIPAAKPLPEDGGIPAAPPHPLEDGR